MADPQLATRRLTATLPAPSMLGRAEVASVTTGYVASADGREGAVTFAPRLGEHTREILAEHGCPEAEIEALHAAGVVRSPETAEGTPRSAPPASGPDLRGAGSAATSATPAATASDAVGENGAGAGFPVSHPARATTPEFPV